MNALILGVGNILLTDEGLGVRAVEALQRDYEFTPAVEILDGGTAGMELLDLIGGKDLLIIVDAVKTGHPPGSVVRIADGDVPAFFRTRISPHQLGISDVLATLLITGETPKEVVILGIEPQSLDTGLEPTPLIAAALGRLIEKVIEELHTHGISATRVAPQRAAS